MRSTSADPFRLLKTVDGRYWTMVDSRLPAAVTRLLSKAGTRDLQYIGGTMAVA